MGNWGKKQKQTKTQSEIENQTLGRAAYSQIQPTLDKIGDLTNNPDTYRQNYLNTYYNSDNSALWSDAQRNLRRQLANATANNYAATNGGYSSTGQQLYDDTLRGLNDYNARLWDAGVQTANGMYQQDVSNMNNLYKTYVGQHDLAATPDAIDAYNDVVDQANKNRWSNIASSLGSAISAIPNGYAKAIGGGLMLAGAAGSKDYSASLNRLQSLANPKMSEVEKAAMLASNTNPATNMTAQMGNIVDSAYGAWTTPNNQGNTWQSLYEDWRRKRNQANTSKKSQTILSGGGKTDDPFAKDNGTLTT